MGRRLEEPGIRGGEVWLFLYLILHGQEGLSNHENSISNGHETRLRAETRHFGVQARTRLRAEALQRAGTDTLFST